MSLPRSVAAILGERVTLEVEIIDRMYVNAYVPGLQYESGVAAFFRKHRRQPFASSALMDPISKAFVAAIHAFVEAEKVPLITFEKGQRKDDVMAAHLARFTAPEGIVFVGRAQEKTRVIRTEKRRNPTTGQAYPWLVRSTAMVHHFYFYGVDRDFGPFFVKFGTYFPYKHSDLKQYLKGLRPAAAGRALRTELTVNDTRDFAIGRRLTNLAALRQVGFQATRRLLDVQRLSLDSTIGDVTVEHVHRPVIVAGQRAPGLRFLDPRVLALFLALVVFRLLPQGFTARELRQHVAPLLGKAPDELSLGQLTYDLRRLRLHGLIDRLPKRHRYRVTDAGLRVALFGPRLWARTLRPGLATVMPDAAPDDSALRRAFARLEQAMDDWCTEGKLAA
jgi:hypothetical protein